MFLLKPLSLVSGGFTYNEAIGMMMIVKPGMVMRPREREWERGREVCCRDAIWGGQGGKFATPPDFEK